MTTLSALSDPTSLCKIQTLFVPVHLSSSSTLSEAIYTHWTDVIKRNQSLRGDDLRRPSPSSAAITSNHQTRTASSSRFFPPSSGSISRSPSNHHVHLAYPSHPPARHLYPLSLLRVASFPLIVIGIAVDPEEEDEEELVNGYSVVEDGGDIGRASTPIPSNPGHRKKPPEREEDPMVAFGQSMSRLFPPTSPFPLVKRLVMVPPHVARSPSAKPSPTKNGSSKGMTADGSGRRDVVYAPSEGLAAWTRRMLGEAIAEALEELGELVRQL